MRYSPTRSVRRRGFAGLVLAAALASGAAPAAAAMPARPDPGDLVGSRSADQVVRQVEVQVPVDDGRAELAQVLLAACGGAAATGFIMAAGRRIRPRERAEAAVGV